MCVYWDCDRYKSIARLNARAILIDHSAYQTCAHIDLCPSACETAPFANVGPVNAPAKWTEENERRALHANTIGKIILNKCCAQTSIDIDCMHWYCCASLRERMLIADTQRLCVRACVCVCGVWTAVGPNSCHSFSRPNGRAALRIDHQLCVLATSMVWHGVSFTCDGLLWSHTRPNALLHSNRCRTEMIINHLFTHVLR